MTRRSRRVDVADAGPEAVSAAAAAATLTPKTERRLKTAAGLLTTTPESRDVSVEFSERLTGAARAAALEPWRDAAGPRRAAEAPTMVDAISRWERAACWWVQVYDEGE